MSCKSAIYAVNYTATAVDENGIIPLTETVRRFGSNLGRTGNNIIANGRGYYAAQISVSALVADAGDVTVSLLSDGVVIPGATATVTAAAGGIVNLSFPAMVRLLCDCTNTTLSLQLTDSAATIQNAAILVEKA